MRLFISPSVYVVIGTFFLNAPIAYSDEITEEIFQFGSFGEVHVSTTAVVS